jgi:hypothetical protein
MTGPNKELKALIGKTVRIVRGNATRTGVLMGPADETTEGQPVPDALWRLMDVDDPANTQEV